MPLLFYGHAGDLAETTSGRILAAAVLAMAGAGLGAVRDPLRNRLVIAMLIGFTTLSAVAIAVRLALGHHEHDPAWLLLPVAVAAPILLTLFYPRA